MSDRQLHVQRLVIKTDPETIEKITKAYDELDRIHEEGRERQCEAERRYRRHELGLE
ncbi:MAG: hypothetical protein WD200_03070 [Candidatus Andersenbacteria bacterium]